MRRSLVLFLSLSSLAHAWIAPSAANRQTRLSLSEEVSVDQDRNPNKPELPLLKGDFDWDAKFGDDSDWVSDPSEIPGKIVLNELALAKQVTDLGRLEDVYRARRVEAEEANQAQVGFVENAELLNGRTAMFFLVTGLLTELWTGVSMPGQVEELLRVAGLLGFE
jgi:hypothetical protein